MALIYNNIKDTKWENKWRQVVKQLSKVLNDANKTKKIDDYAKGGEEIKILQDALDEKRAKLKKLEDSLIEEKETIEREKISLEVGGTKNAWEMEYNSFRDSYRGTTGGWKTLVKAHYPADYTDNLYTVDGKQITEDQVNKILARVIYEIGRLDKGDFVANHGITDAGEKASAENTFDEIVRMSKEIEELNKVGDSQVEVEVTNDDGSKKKVSAWKDRTKTWDLPMTYSEPQKVHSNSNRPNNNKPLVTGKNDGDNEKVINGRSTGWNLEVQEVKEFIDKVLTDEIIEKLKQDNITKEEKNFDIYQAGDVYDDETLEVYGIEVGDKLATALYRSKLKYDETTKSWKNTDKMPINIQKGLKDWIKLFKSVFSTKETCEKLEKGLKATNPNYLLFNDLRTQKGTGHNFQSGTNNYRLYESLEGIKELEKNLLLGQGEEIQKIRTLRDEVGEGKRQIAGKEAENKKLRVGIQDIIDEVLEKKREALKAYKLEDGFDGDHQRDWITLRRIQKLILEIRYLENDGDPTRECAYETTTGNPNHCQGLVGYVDNSCRVGGELDETKKILLYTKKDGTEVRGFKPTDGTLDQIFVVSEGEINDRFYLFKYFSILAENGTKRDVDHAIKQIKDNKDELLDGLKTEDKFKLYQEHFEGIEQKIKFGDWEEKAKKAIDKALGKNTEETAQDWRNKLKVIDASLDDSSLINDGWKDKWTALGDNFKNISKVEALLNKVKGKTDFLAKAKTITGDNTVVDWKSLMALKPEKIIGAVTRYELNHSPDNDKDEKKKEQTQMKRRIAKKKGKPKVEDLTDEEINTALYKDAIGEETIDRTKFYDASLKEITTQNPPKEQTPEQPFLRWTNPWLYLIGAVMIGIVCAVVWWEEFMSLFNNKEDKDE